MTGVQTCALPISVLLAHKIYDQVTGVVGRQRNEDLPLGMRDDVGIGQLARALLDPPLAEGQKLRQPAIGGAVGGEAEKGRAVLEDEAAADDQADLRFLRCLVRADDAVETPAPAAAGSACPPRTARRGAS